MHSPSESRADAQPAASSARDSLRGLFANRDFGFYVGVRVATMLGQSIQSAAIMWQVYDVTNSPVALAFVGIAKFVPALAISLLAGAITDTRDRRTVLALSQIVPLLTSSILAALTMNGTITLTPIYVAVVLLGVSGAFEGPSRQTILPIIVPNDSYQRAVSVATIVQQIASVFGPAVAGLAIAQSGVAPAYLMHVGLVLTGLVCLMCIRANLKVSGGKGLNVAMVREGIAFIWTHPAVLGAMALDMFAVIFAGADALLPIFARDILGVGAFGYGLLTSSKAVGSLVTALIIAVAPPIVNTGRAMVVSVALFGAATVAFGFSTSFPLSLLLYGLISAFDQVSVVMRQTIINLGTPNELRGRVGSVNSIFVGASNQLGAAESGLVAAWANSAVFAVVFGGAGCLVAVAGVMVTLPTLWRHRQVFHAEEPVPVENAGQEPLTNADKRR